jgi:hypothetical protein
MTYRQATSPRISLSNCLVGVFDLRMLECRVRFVAFLSLALGVFTVLPEASAAPQEREYILVSGGPALVEWEEFKEIPHDIWWGNFIRSARVRIQELQRDFGPGVDITWLVYKRGYVRRGQRQDNRDLIALIESVRDRYGVRLVWFESGDEVINYLNQGRPRDRVKIANFEFYGHSNSKAFMFDYSNEIDSASKSWLHEDELGRIRRGIFARNAFIKSWGCHTGESMTAKWRRATGTRMVGAVGKTDYSLGYRFNWVPQLSPGGRWVR